MNYTTSDLYTNSTTPSIALITYLEICVFTFNFLFGILTHSYVIWLIITGTGIASEFFILNLSVCEIGNSLNSLFYMLSLVFPCFFKLVAFLQGLAVAARPLFQCLICFECYLAVVHPVTFLKYKPLRYRVICCSVAWIIVLGSCLFLRFTLHPLNFKAYCWFFCTLFFFFLSIQLFCLVAVLRALKQSGPGERGRERKEDKNYTKRRAFKIILISTVNVAVIYVPFAITTLYNILTQQYRREDAFAALLFYVLAGFIQPVLYLHRAGKLFSCSS